MYTECPTCNTLFRVRPDQLNAAGGNVRCGECLALFDGRRYLRDDPAPALSATTTEPSRPEDGHLATPPALETPPLQRESDAPRRESRAPATRRRLPLDLDFRFAPQVRSPQRTRAWVSLNAALLGLLVGQSLWFNRAALQELPALRPLFETLCWTSDCPWASVQDPTVFELTSRGVRTHPTFEGALLIDALFVNRAAAPRSHPGVEVIFTDSEGIPVARRRFSPEEYLGVKPQRPLAPGDEAHLVLELLDPGDLAVGYEFRFF